MLCAVRRASDITVNIGFVPEAVGNALASPIQTPGDVVQLAAAVGDRASPGRSPSGSSPSGGR